jgi:hypothetical protein
MLWLFMQTFSLLRERWIKVVVVIVLSGMIINFRQVLVPIVSRDPFNSITEDYHYDLTDLQSYMLANVKKGDVLITSRIYGRYVEWVGTPTFRKIYDFQVQSTKSDVLFIVDQYDSGWIVIDNARIDRATFAPESVFLENDRIEYVHSFNDEHVWRWGVK